MPADWFRKRSKFTGASAGQIAATVPDGVATKCARCNQIIFTKDLQKNLKVCPLCGSHHKLTAAERIEYTVDEGSFSPLSENLRSIDLIQFPDYQNKLDKGVNATGKGDAVTIGTARVKSIPVVIGVSDFFFMGGSMGSVAGEKVVRCIEEGINRNQPVIFFTASGGARMQEGLTSLMQMAKTSAAVGRLANKKIPFIVVMADPTTAGVLASYASLGDLILAEPGATIGFAGARVAAQVTTQKPPADYQTAEWQLSRGQIDQVVHRKDLPDTLASLLNLLGFEPIDSGIDTNINNSQEVKVGE